MESHDTLRPPAPGRAERESMAAASLPLGEGRGGFRGWAGTASARWDGRGRWARARHVNATFRYMNRLLRRRIRRTGPRGSLPRIAGWILRCRQRRADHGGAPAGLPVPELDGDLSGSSLTGMVTMSAPRAVQAMLERVPYVAPTGVAKRR